jgi:hypothetical protein
VFSKVGLEGSCSAKKIQLHLIGIGSREIEVVERILVWRDQGCISRSVRVVPDSRLRKRRIGGRHYLQDESCQ